jgi:hypothetical protein
MAVYLNFKYCGTFKDGGKFKFKAGGIFEYGGKFKMKEITRWRYFKYGSCARSINFKDGGIFEYD